MAPSFEARRKEKKPLEIFGVPPAGHEPVVPHLRIGMEDDKSVVHDHSIRQDV